MLVCSVDDMAGGLGLDDEPVAEHLATVERAGLLVVGDVVVEADPVTGRKQKTLRWTVAGERAIASAGFSDSIWRS